MFRRLINAISAIRQTRTSARYTAKAKRREGRRPTLENLEDRLVPSSAPLYVAGTQLQDPAGHAVVLRGVNVSGLESYPTGLDFDNQGNSILLNVVDEALNNWHANLIRVTVYQDFWFGHDEGAGLGEAGDGGAAYRGLVDQIVNMAQADNAYVMLTAWGSDMGSFGAAPALHDLPDMNTQAFWQDAAARYANNPTVLFDPFNEPHDATFSQWLNGGSITENGTTYDSPGMQGLLDTIRGTGANNIVSPEGLGYGSDLSGVEQGFALNDPAGSLMYQFHIYPAEDSIPAGPPSVANRDALVQTVAGQYPIYIGEWGTYSDQDNNPDKANIGAGWPDAAGWSQNMVSWLTEHQYNWTAWTFGVPQNGGPNLISDFNYTPTSYYGAFVKQALAANTAAPVSDLTGVEFSLTAAEDGSTHDLLIQSETLQPDGTAQITGLYDGQSASGTLSANADGSLAISFGPSANVGIDGTISGNPGQYTIFGINRADQGGIAPELNGVQVMQANPTPVADLSNVSFTVYSDDGTVSHQLVLQSQTAQADGSATFAGVWDQANDGGTAVSGDLSTDAAGNITIGFTIDQSSSFEGTVSGQAGAYHLDGTLVQGDASSFTHLSGGQDQALAAQTITFGALPDATDGDAPITLGATADSGLPVSYQVLSGPATVQDNVLTITGAGIVTVEASQAGDGVNFAAATPVDQAFTVNQAATMMAMQTSARTTTVGHMITFTATVAAQNPGAGLPDGTVTWMDGNNVLGTATLTNGVAVYPTASLGAGKHTITAVYGGSDNFMDSTSAALTETIKRAATKVALTSSARTIAFGHTIELTATIGGTASGAPAPTGTVIFKDGSIVLGRATVVNGVAVFDIAKLKRGRHTITAVYSGDADYLGSTSTASVVTIK